jgi:hypothetical protein
VICVGILMVSELGCLALDPVPTSSINTVSDRMAGNEPAIRLVAGKVFALRKQCG